MKPTVASEMRDRSNGRGAHSREFVSQAQERFKEECTFAPKINEKSRQVAE
jgi:hypothetical protein